MKNKKMDIEKISYVDLIDEVATRAAAIHWLEFLHHIGSNELHDYIKYTSSIIKRPDKSNSQLATDIRYINAIEKKDYRAMKIMQATHAINSLDRCSRELLMMKYLNHMNDKEIQKTLKISDRTFRERLRQAYINFAIVLHIEVLKC